MFDGTPINRYFISCLLPVAHLVLPAIGRSLERVALTSAQSYKSAFSVSPWVPLVRPFLVSPPGMVETSRLQVKRSLSMSPEGTRLPRLKSGVDSILAPRSAYTHRYFVSASCARAPRSVFPMA